MKPPTEAALLLKKSPVLGDETGTILMGSRSAAATKFCVRVAYFEVGHRSGPQSANGQHCGLGSILKEAAY